MNIKDWRKKLLSFVKQPVFVVLIICLVLLALNIVFIGHFRPFNSDDLYWQQVVRTWPPFSGHTLYLATKDIFIEEVPFFAIMEHIFSPSRKLLLAESGILTLSSFIFFYSSSLYFLRKIKAKLSYLTLLPFIWLSSFGYPLVQNYLNSDWRTFEVGLSFLTFMLVAAITFKDIQPLRTLRTKILSVVVLAYIGIVIYSDPYFLYFTIAPLFLFVLALYGLRKINRKQLAVLCGGTVLAMIFAKIAEIACAKAGVVIATDIPSAFVNFDNIVTNIISSIHGLLIVFGADFFGRQAFKLGTLGAIFNATILFFILHRVYSYRTVVTRFTKSKRLSLPSLWVTFFGFLLVFIFVIYTLTTLVLVSNYRFYILFIYCAITFLVFILANSSIKHLKLVLGLVIAVAISYNLAGTILFKNFLGQPGIAGNVGNSMNFEIINSADDEGLTKGYASYWQANVNTYFSNGKITFLPAICDAGVTRQFRWLIDGSQFNKKSSLSFYLMDPDFTAPPSCTEDKLLSQFGKPKKIRMIGNKRMLIYDYDIGDRILPFDKF